MKNNIGILNFGAAGNIRSIQKALEKAGSKALLINAPKELKKISKIVLPGVGSFPDAMQELESKKFTDPLKKFILQHPTLGICLGMQILSRIGFEFKETRGLEIFDSEVKPVICNNPVPHMGFNKINIQKNSPILKGLKNESFYFMHSFEVVNYKDVIALSNYGDHEFVSAISKKHIFGVQFHPEKSRDAGIKLFKNFINI